jgi:ABC-type Zn uptake system ZnuABC Zn-binding protein ZnuA
MKIFAVCAGISPRWLVADLIAVGIVTLALHVQAAERLRVITSTPDFAAIATEVGGDRVDVLSLAKGTQNPHFVDARPSFIVELNKTDMLIEGGLELEIGWLPPLLLSARNPNLQPNAPGRVVAALNVPIREVPTFRVDRSMGDVHPAGNPHFTLDPDNGKIMAETIADALIRIHPQDTAVFQANLERFKNTLDAKIQQWVAQMDPFRGAKVVSYHKTYNYFIERFGLDLISTVEPKPGVPPSPAHVEALTALMKAQGVRVVMLEPYYVRALPDVISRETGAQILILPTMPGGVPEVQTYADVFQYNINALTNALRAGQ